MADLYLIGAGCSRNYVTTIQKIFGLKSPLNNDFFKMAKLVITNSGMKNDPIFMENVSLLIKELSILYNKENEISLFDHDVLNLEDAMTYLDINNKLFELKNYRGYSTVYLDILKDILVRTLDYSQIGKICNKHIKIAKNIKKGDVIINFNYDLLMDVALYNLGLLSDSGYHMNFYRKYENSKWSKLNESNSAVSYYKLHGSINWVRCTVCGSLLKLSHEKSGDLYGYVDFNCPRCGSDDTYCERLIIPPMQAKDYSDKAISYLWIKADSSMVDFEHITCIGYSFSKFDYALTTLIRRYVSRRSTNPFITYVSRTNKKQKRIMNLFNCENSEINFISFNKYINSL